MKIVFFGSSDFSVPFLEQIANKVVLVVTSPDKRRGRGKKFLPNPVKDAAMKLGINFIAEDFFKEEIIEKIKNLAPELFVVVSYGKIIPPELLSIPRHAINVHPSKLPFYRGAAPIERQILDGVTHSVVSIIKVNRRLDRGDIILEQPFDIAFYDTKEDVENKIIDVGRKLLIEIIGLLEEGEYEGRKQIGKGSYARKITREDEIISWENSAVKIYNKVRALYPSPSAQTTYKGKILKIFKSAPVDGMNEKAEKGEIISVNKNSFFVLCGTGVLRILEVQLEGRKRIPAKDFINGMHVKVGEKLGK